MPKTPPKPTTVTAEIVDVGKSRKPIPTITREEADIIQVRIREKVERVAQSLATDIIDIARDLREVHRTKAWAYYTETWTSYLEDYREFSRSYMFNLAKLGQAGDETLQKLLGMGLGATQLVEYARIAPTPEQIEPLVKKTWQSVKGLPVKEMAKTVRETAQGIQPPKKAAPGKPRGRKPKEWIERFKDLYDLVPTEQQSDFAKAVRSFLRSAE